MSYKYVNQTTPGDIYQYLLAWCSLLTILALAFIGACTDLPIYRVLIFSKSWGKESFALITGRALHIIWTIQLTDDDPWPLHTYSLLGAYWTNLYFLQLLLAIGTKLEHVIAQLAHDVAEKHTAVEGDVIVKPSDEHFWFGKPRIILYLIHFILFQNAFEIAFFFWILVSRFFFASFVNCIEIWELDTTNIVDPPLSFLEHLWIWLVHHGTSSFYCAKACHRVFKSLKTHPFHEEKKKKHQYVMFSWHLYPRFVLAGWLFSFSAATAPCLCMQL